MTEQELIAQLNNKFSSVIEENKRKTGEEGTLEHWAIPVADIENDVLKRQWVHYYIETSTGDTYWQDREPKPAIETKFSKELTDYINQKIADGTIEGAFVESLNEVNETAIVSAYIDNNGITKKTLIVDKENEQIRHRQIS